MGRRKKRETKGSPRRAITGADGSVWRYPSWMHGKWRTSIRLASGSVRWVTLDAESESEARDEVARRAQQPSDKEAPSRETLLSAILAWRKDTEGDIRAITALTRNTAIEHLREHFGDKRRLATITAEDLRRFVTERLEKEKGCAKTTVKQYVMIIRGLFDWAWRYGRAPVNPFDRFKLTGPRGSWSQGVREGRALTIEEVGKLLLAAEEVYTAASPISIADGGDVSTPPPLPDLHDQIVVMLRVGLRCANVSGPSGITWGDLDLTQGAEVLSIDPKRMKNSLNFIVPLHPDVAGILRRRREELVRRGVVPAASMPVFGPAPFRSVLRDAFDATVRRAKIGRVTPHDLRRTFRTDAERVIPRTAAEVLLGHKLSQLDRAYVKLTVEDLRAEIRKLPSVLPAKDKASRATGTGK